MAPRRQPLGVRGATTTTTTTTTGVRSSTDRGAGGCAGQPAGYFVLCTYPAEEKLKRKETRERERVRTYYAWSGRYTDTITRLEYRLHTASSIISRRCRRSHEKKKLWKRIGWVRECTGIRVQRENNERNRKSKAKPTIKAQAGNQVFLHTALLLSLTSSVL